VFGYLRLTAEPLYICDLRYMIFMMYFRSIYVGNLKSDVESGLDAKDI
jgi:hypothetical protein